MQDKPITLLSGDRMYIDPLDSLQLKSKGIYEKAETEFIKSFIKSYMTCVDVGANIGYFTIIMAKLAKHVYAFEPEELNYATLHKNITLNNIINVTSYQYAVGNEIGIAEGGISYVTLYKCPTNCGMHRIYRSEWCNGGDTQYNVPIIALDSIIGHVDFIKMDIEGAEYGALLGMRRILSEGTTLLMEFHMPSIKEYGKNPVDIYNYMTSLDYDITLLSGKKLTWNELNKQATLYPTGTNIVCTPRK